MKPKLKKGDRVKITYWGAGGDDVTLGKIYTMLDSRDFLDDDGDIRHIKYGKFVLQPPTYPNPPHKHAELIKAWADGAKIERKLSANCPWAEVHGTPLWVISNDYRIKPTKENKKLEEISAIEEEMRKLADRLEKIKHDE